MNNLNYSTGYQEGREDGKTDERQAWLEGRRCTTCGNEIEPKGFIDTCDNCWRNAKMKREDLIKRIQLGAEFKYHRKLMGFTQEFIAKELGLNRQAIIALEAGKREINSFEYFKLVELLGVSPLAKDSQAESLETYKKYIATEIREQAVKKTLMQFKKICDDYDFLKGLN